MIETMLNMYDETRAYYLLAQEGTEEEVFWLGVCNRWESILKRLGAI